jgi:hypothetical protein
LKRPSLARAVTLWPVVPTVFLGRAHHRGRYVGGERLERRVGVEDRVRPRLAPDVLGVVGVLGLADGAPDHRLRIPPGARLGDPVEPEHEPGLLAPVELLDRGFGGVRGERAHRARDAAGSHEGRGDPPPSAPAPGPGSAARRGANPSPATTSPASTPKPAPRPSAWPSTSAQTVAARRRGEASGGVRLRLLY